MPKLAALQQPLWPNFIVVHCPLARASLRVEFDHQYLLLFADRESATVAIIDQCTAFNSAQIVRRYI